METLKQPQEDPTATASETQLMEEEKQGGEQGQEVPEKTADNTTPTMTTMEEEEKEVIARMSERQAQVYQELRLAAEGFVKKLINPQGLI